MNCMQFLGQWAVAGDKRTANNGRTDMRAEKGRGYCVVHPAGPVVSAPASLTADLARTRRYTAKRASLFDELSHCAQYCKYEEIWDGPLIVSERQKTKGSENNAVIVTEPPTTFIVQARISTERAGARAERAEQACTQTTVHLEWREWQ